MGRFKEMPPQECKTMSAEDGERLMHISLPISKETVLMGSDTGGEWSQAIIVGNNFSISVNTDSEAEADRIFKELSAGGNVGMPMADTFWGDYFGMFTDKFAINWMISFNDKQNQG